MTKQKGPKIVVGIQIPRGLHRAVKAAARREHRSVGGLIRRLIDDAGITTANTD